MKEQKFEKVVTRKFENADVYAMTIIFMIFMITNILIQDKAGIKWTIFFSIVEIIGIILICFFNSEVRKVYWRMIE